MDHPQEVICFTTVEPANLPKLHMCQGGFERIKLISRVPGCNMSISFNNLCQSEIDKVPEGTLAYRSDAIERNPEGTGIIEGFKIIDLKVAMQVALNLDEAAYHSMSHAMSKMTIDEQISISELNAKGIERAAFGGF